MAVDHVIVKLTATMDKRMKPAAAASSEPSGL